MDIVILGIVIFLFLLACFDLMVGVSNDAVNFLNSAVGSKAAKFKHIIIVAAIGVFFGAVMSNGMMDVVRHGIFRPENFSVYDLLCIFMAVIVVDIILLDVFNTLGLPTSTTVSMVFELLGAAFVVSLFKITSGESTVDMGDLLNTEKALSVIIGIFLSVAVAFFFGTLVQFLTRLYFTFDYKKNLKWKIGIFGGLATTAIIYFMLLKGTKDLSFMTSNVKDWITVHTGTIIICCLIVSTIVMQVLHSIGVNVFKVIVMIGTFSLAMAFAGNDLVNFIGVPLTGLASYQEYAASGATDPNTVMMGILNNPANTSIWFLLGAGLIMVYSLATSKKAQAVVNTNVNLSKQGEGDEMFGSSRLARRLVRLSLSTIYWVRNHTPVKVRKWINKRMDSSQIILEDGAAYDLVRGSINLVISGLLIALGTSMKLPLSTTYVTFMVAMGASLADRAWSRDSAVFRITGVISVIGGWFITAGVAFIGAGIVVSIMHWGGYITMIVIGLAAGTYLVYNNLKYNQKNDENDDVLFTTILSSQDSEVWDLLKVYLAEQYKATLTYVDKTYKNITFGFLNDKGTPLEDAERSLIKQKAVLKNYRRKETLCMSKLDRVTALEKNTWFYLANNTSMAMIYNLRRINETCKEHIDNNFRPLPALQAKECNTIETMINDLFAKALAIIENPKEDEIKMLRKQCDGVKDFVSAACHRLYDNIRNDKSGNMTVLYVYLNYLQETQEMVSNLRKMLRAIKKMLAIQ